MVLVPSAPTTVTVPIVYRSGDDTDIVWIRGQKVQGETNNIHYNFQKKSATPIILKIPKIPFTIQPIILNAIIIGKNIR